MGRKNLAESSNDDIGRYLEMALELGASDAQVIQPARVPTSEWVRWKCQFGCPRYARGYCCPPESPTPIQTRAVLDSYRRGILMHFEIPALPGGAAASRERHNELHENVVDLEETVFKDGHYRAFALLFGPCTLCPECAKESGEPCNFRGRVRPAMEACGIDVFKTVRDLGGTIRTLRDRSETRHQYALLLID